MIFAATEMVFLMKFNLLNCDPVDLAAFETCTDFLTCPYTFRASSGCLFFVFLPIVAVNAVFAEPCLRFHRCSAVVLFWYVLYLFILHNLNCSQA